MRQLSGTEMGWVEPVGRKGGMGEGCSWEERSGRGEMVGSLILGEIIFMRGKALIGLVAVNECAFIHNHHLPFTADNPGYDSALEPRCRHPTQASGISKFRAGKTILLYLI